MAEVRRLLLEHLQDHYGLYGQASGVRSARKHIAWYVRDLPGGEAFRQQINTMEDCAAQWQAVADFFDALGAQMDRLPLASDDGAPVPRGRPVGILPARRDPIARLRPPNRLQHLPRRGGHRGQRLAQCRARGLVRLQLARERTPGRGSAEHERQRSGSTEV